MGAVWYGWERCPFHGVELDTAKRCFECEGLVVRPESWLTEQEAAARRLIDSAIALLEGAGYRVTPPEGT